MIMLSERFGKTYPVKEIGVKKSGY
jgi:hypothetical protein